ncbi:hypothetical protein LCGC14_2715640 [marine sediment metagenome]|uniref:Uncharacterized protein n=1 Tax=marine sediment metagenome TaxID=412755 RepID=A0A0F9C3B5_9ZZZZ
MKLCEVVDRDQHWVVYASVEIPFDDLDDLDQAVVKQSDRFSTAFANVNWILRTRDEGKFWTRYIFGITGNDVLKVHQSIARGFRRLQRGKPQFTMSGISEPYALKVGTPETVHRNLARKHDLVTLIKGSYR